MNRFVVCVVVLAVAGCGAQSGASPAVQRSPVARQFESCAKRVGATIVHRASQLRFAKGTRLYTGRHQVENEIVNVGHDHAAMAFFPVDDSPWRIYTLSRVTTAAERAEPDYARVYAQALRSPTSLEVVAFARGSRATAATRCVRQARTGADR